MDTTMKSSEPDVINIFDRIVRKIKIEIRQEGPLSLSYICQKYGAPAMTELLLAYGVKIEKGEDAVDAMVSLDK